MQISSSFSDGGTIPAKHAMKTITGGQNVSPSVLIQGIPAGTISIAIAFIDRIMSPGDKKTHHA